jgi:peptide-methionine (R)-S-oxide reductase
MIMKALSSRREMLGFVGLGTAAVFIALAPGRGAAATFELRLSEAEWRRRLGPERFRILRQAGTERPYSSPLLNEKRRGVFACAGCGLPLFSSAAKYDSGTGWPSFWKALPKAVVYERDLTLGMIRTEELCRRCGGHLGHLFDDGPRPNGKRHCINGLSLKFLPLARPA